MIMDYSRSGSHSSADRRGGSDESTSGKSRPVSRRGLRHNSDSTRSSTHLDNTRVGAMRPSSAYRGGTASRLSTGSLGLPPPPTAARLGTANITGVNMLDRPITQQGLSGVRAGTAGGGGRLQQRQLRDRRYWEEVLSGRSRALRAEITRLHQLADTRARERSANKHFEARGKELAQELTDLQGRLSDYNLAAQLVTGSDVAALQRQTAELLAGNEQRTAELEAVFSERQRKEGQLRQINEQMNKEKGAIDSLLGEMSPSERSAYLQLREDVETLKNEADDGRMQVEELTRVKGELERQISISQMKTVMVELLRKLMAVEQKRDSLVEEMNTKLQPAQERDQLLAQVREDNMAISSMESNSQSVREEIKRAQNLLEQAEQDLEEGQSERHQKYRELKKREETMEVFMSAFDQNMRDERERIGQLEADIVFALEHTSSSMDQFNFDEIDTLRQREGAAASHAGAEEGNKTIDGLIKEYNKLRGQLKKAKDTEERLTAEMRALPEKISSLQQASEVVANLEKLKTDGAEKRRELKEEAASLRDKLAPTESAVKEAAKRYRELQKRLDGNEMYSMLNGMEERLASIEAENAAVREDVASITIKTDYEPIRKQVFGIVESINHKLSLAVNNQLLY